MRFPADATALTSEQWSTVRRVLHRATETMRGSTGAFHHYSRSKPETAAQVARACTCWTSLRPRCRCRCARAAGRDRARRTCRRAVPDRDALANPACLPDARIVELNDAGITPRDYDDLDAVRLTRGFLEAPERYLHAALEDLDSD
jgi:hypothetical protein